MNVQGPANFSLMAACARCTTHNLKCNRRMPCASCLKAGAAGCTPSNADAVARAREVHRLVHAGAYPHCDLAKYQIHLQTTVYQYKTLLGRIDAADVYKRILEERFEMREFDEGVGPSFDLPPALREMGLDKTHFKIEYFKNGHYVSVHSKAYDKDIMTEHRLSDISYTQSIAPKLVDTCGMDDFKMAYRMWIETLRYPYREIKYTGHTFWKISSGVHYSTIKMMSAVLSPTCIITLTVMEVPDIFKTMVAN